MTTPKLVHEVLEERAKNDADRPAMRVKRNGGWRTTTWGSYARDAKRAARAFIKLGVERGKGVALIGYNCPEWVIADVGAILAGAMPAGIYTTNSAEQVRYITHHCEAKVAFAEDQKQVKKFVDEADRLPQLTTVVQMMGRPEQKKQGRLDVLAWDEFLALADEVPESKLEERIK